ncbi:hypothetical protein BH10BAC4_BH10BAC4_01310 [soil metagenome]
MEKNIGGRWVLLLLMATCSHEQKITAKTFDFEHLINEQVNELSQRGRILDKTGKVSNKKSDTTFVPTKSAWQAELEIFQQLNDINRLVGRSKYKITDPLEDTKSNLKIREYVASKPKGDAWTSETLPSINSMKFYYHDDFSQLKRIEATIAENNMLYSNSRDLIMEFEEEDGTPVLNRYSMFGFQKMMFRDTVRFSILGQIEHSSH